MKSMLSASIHRWVHARWRDLTNSPHVGQVNFGDLRRIRPISRVFGYDRGLPIDRYYVEQFLGRHGGDIHGRVLEIGDNTYTLRFGGDRVTHSDVLHVVEGNPKATLVGDLTNAAHIATSVFNCIILTQTLHFIYDLRSALGTIYRILKPGGVVLATVPGISQWGRGEWSKAWYWSFTTCSARRIFEEVFPSANVTVETFGNVLTAIAFLQGLAVEDLRREELDHHDPFYHLLLTVRAVKPEVHC